MQRHRDAVGQEDEEQPDDHLDGARAADEAQQGVRDQGDREDVHGVAPGEGEAREDTERSGQALDHVAARTRSRRGLGDRTRHPQEADRLGDVVHAQEDRPGRGPRRPRPQANREADRPRCSPRPHPRTGARSPSARRPPRPETRESGTHRGGAGGAGSLRQSFRSRVPDRSRSSPPESPPRGPGRPTRRGSRRCRRGDGRRSCRPASAAGRRPSCA